MKHQQYGRSPRQLCHTRSRSLCSCQQSTELGRRGWMPRQPKAHPCQKETLPVSESLKPEVLQLLREKVPRMFYQGQTTHTFFLRLHLLEAAKLFWLNFPMWKGNTGQLGANTLPAWEKTSSKADLMKTVRSWMGYAKFCSPLHNLLSETEKDKTVQHDWFGSRDLYFSFQ